MPRRASNQNAEETLAHIVDNFDRKDKLALARTLRDRLHLTRDSTYLSQVQGKISRPLSDHEKVVVRALEKQVSLAYPSHGGKSASRATAKRTARKTTRKTARRSAKRTARKTTGRRAR